MDASFPVYVVMKYLIHLLLIYFCAIIARTQIL